MRDITVLIVDDEPIARRGIRRQVEAFPGARVVGECAHGREAVAAIRRQAPDLVFLDVQMPELSGFEVVEQVGTAAMPTVIFVTAYDAYALRAFEAHALDYLLKPLDPERFRHAFERAVDRVRRDDMADLGRRLDRVIATMERPPALPPPPPPADRLVVRDGGRIFFLDTDDIRWVAAAGNYVELHTADRTHLIRETLQALETRFEPLRFVRISRSAMVNLRFVREFRPRHKGSYILHLQGGTELVSSRHYRDNIEALWRDA
jgi:two-component system LytT family response regulator